MDIPICNFLLVTLNPVKSPLEKLVNLSSIVTALGENLFGPREYL